MAELEIGMGLLEAPPLPADQLQSRTVLEWAYDLVEGKIAQNEELSKAIEIIVEHVASTSVKQCLTNRDLSPQDLGHNQGFAMGAARLRAELCDVERIAKSRQEQGFKSKEK